MQQSLFSDIDNELLSPYKMPEQYKGKMLTHGGITKFTPRKWTQEEEDYCKMLKDKNFSTKQIAECIGRDELQVSIKMKRLAKANNTYNDPHRAEKYQKNNEFLKALQPKTILDLFAGKVSFYEGKATVTANDISFNGVDALDFLCQKYVSKEKYDLVDLDPFGSAYDCFDLAIKVAQKGLIITLGEMGHKRWKRLDFVKRHYFIEKIEDFTTENLIKHILAIGERNKKKLTPVIVCEWRNISRVYFLIEPFKTTEQWD